MNISLYVKHEQERRHLARQNARIALEVGTAPPETTNPAALPGDAFQLRGIPVVGVKGGLGGAIAGSRPGVTSGESG